MEEGEGRGEGRRGCDAAAARWVCPALQKLVRSSRSNHE
jgi:hypothetical protein